jgi:hypothetical protein
MLALSHRGMKTTSYFDWRWIQVPEMENRYLRVILLEDGETVHNAFLDRRFVP